MQRRELRGRILDIVWLVAACGGDLIGLACNDDVERGKNLLGKMLVVDGERTLSDAVLKHKHSNFNFVRFTHAARTCSLQSGKSIEIKADRIPWKWHPCHTGVAV